MPANANGTRHGLSAIAGKSLEEEMAAFDELPHVVREAMNYFPLRASAVELIDKIKEGVTVEEIMARYRFNLRMFPLSFVKLKAK